MRAGLHAFAYGCVATLAAWSAYSYVFSHFAHYDDQGYVLMVVRSFSDGAPLYEETFSQYGPFFAIFHRALFAFLGMPLDLNSSGLVQVGYWAGTTTIAGIAAHISTRRLSLGLLTAASSFVVLSTLRHEPLHPIALIAFLLSCVWLALALVPRWPRGATAGLGVLGAAVALVKVNVGFFLVLGLAFGVSVTSERLRRTIWFPAVLSLVAIGTPAVLMREDIMRETNPRFAFVIGSAALSLAVVNAAFAGRPADHRRGSMWFAVGFSSVVAVVVGVTLATGTGPLELIEGTLLRPVRQPDVFTIPWRRDFLPASVSWFAAAGTLGGIGMAAASTWSRWSPRGWHLSLVKLAAALLTVSSLVVGWPWPYLAMASIAWVAAVDVPGSRVPSLVRSAMPMIAVLHVLHAYPVAGAQRGVAVFLLIVVAVICFEDAWSLSPFASGERGRSRVQATAIAASLGAVVMVASGPVLEWWAGDWGAYREGRSLSLPGAERYHIEASRVATYRHLSDALTERCTTFYSLPGLGSLYVFTRTRPPISYFATDWMDLLSDGEQASVVAALEDAERPCIVRYEKALAVWLQGEDLPDTPLVEHIRSEYEVVETVGPYELMARREGL